MTIVQSISSFLVNVPSNWTGNWVWGLPLIVLTVVIHVLGLGLIRQRTLGVSSVIVRHRHQTVAFLVMVGRRNLAGDCPSRDRGEYLGCRLPTARCFT
jgi:hypothetical protein